MDQLPPHEVGVILLSCSFLAALIVGGIAGYFGGMLAGAGAGALAVSAMSLAAAWITWQGGDRPAQGMVRVEGKATMEAESDRWTRAAEPLSNHDLVIRYADAGGAQHRISAANADQALAPGQTVNIDYPAGKLEQAAVANSGQHRTLLIVFLLFGCIPLAMGLAMLAAAWEDRAGALSTPAPRSAAVLRACSWARVPANLTFIAGFVVMFWNDGLASIGAGFPLIGAGALVHAVIGVVAGVRLSGVLTFVVVAAGFIGFGLFAQSVG